MAKANCGYMYEIITKTTGKKVNLETINNWIIPKKLGVEAMQDIMQFSTNQIDTEKIQDVSENTVTAIVEEMKKPNKKFSGDLTLMAKVAFLNGIYDHNFFMPVLLKDENGSIKRDEDGDLLAEEDENGEALMKKAEINEETFNRLSDYFELIMEIYTIVMKFNTPAKKKISGK